ncbi:hypothetical protein GCM10009557_71880 [Virgisporangium ochraceum]|uniref:Uncharacterized protein n=2 Tax=Virgisporangium ochraceum TaxID=65505 RepID=A0A8J4EGS6_9ACTN|nr:hypothetical protein Voc01_063740 [Virgisporangium ochraceum]
MPIVHAARLADMRLWGAAGSGVDMRVVGYQFPDADDPAERCSWHLVEGTATCDEGSWSWRYPALTCDESPRLSAWLRDVAVGSAGSLSFLEPNLTLTLVGRTRNAALIEIGLDLEFAPPWRPRRAAGTPYRISCDVHREQLLRAADDWDAEIAPYPHH